MLGSKELSRQLSLNSESTVTQKRKNFKKQYSEDIPHYKETEQKFNLFLKNNSKILDRPPRVKIAWAENMRLSLDEVVQNNEEQGVIAKKCKEVKRPVTAKITKQNSLDKDSILYSRQELAERLRQAWNDREKGKQNLDIFLAHNVKNDDDLTDNETPNEKITPAIMLPLQPNLVGHENDYKNIFQKQRNNRKKLICNENLYGPNKTFPSTIVVVPVIENDTIVPPPTSKNPAIKQQKSKNDETEFFEKSPNEYPKPINNIIIRPSTAASKRDSFRKRTNSAFTGSLTKENNFRPPLVRASSVPSKPVQEKSKFIATKRRIKSAKRIGREKKIVDDDDDDDEKDENGKINKKCLRRSMSSCGTDVVTMVSLVSPAGSDTEEVVGKPKEKSKSRNNSPVKNSSKKEEKTENPKNFSLRRTVKSASFPARRGSVASALMLADRGLKLGSGPQKMQEKRAPVENHPDDEREPKRKLVRTKSGPLNNSHKEDNLKEGTHEIAEKTISPPSSSENATNDLDEKADELPVAELDDKEPKFENPKEKQCWEMYCKMSEKGVTVSFDTILRGMLTPTEYRLRRKPSIPTTSDNC